MGKENDNKNNKGIKKVSKLVSKRNVLLLVLGLLIFTVVILLSPLFGITEIEISEVTLYSPEEIYSAFEEYKGNNGYISLLKNTTFAQIDNMFRLRFTEKEMSMLFDYPLIKDIKVEYDVPGKLVVSIEERTPVLVTEKDGMYLYVDSEGYLLGAYTQADKPDMPVVKGIVINDYKVGAKIADGKNVSIDAAIKICGMMKQLSMLSHIDIIDVSDYNNIRMFCAPSLAIEFGSLENLKVRLSILKGVFDTGVDGSSNGTIDMTGSNVPVFRENT